MKWLRYLEKYNISFSINILNKGDSILTDKNNKFMYIIEGFIQKLQVFTNKEILCTQLLYKHYKLQRLQSTTKTLCIKNNHSYKFVALTRTIILTINEKELMNKGRKNYLFIHSSCYHRLIYNKDMIKVSSHKSTKKRLIQLLFILIERLGIFTENKFLIPLNLPHHTIATVIGSQRITVSKIMNELRKKKVLSYDNQQISIANIIQLIY